MQTVPERVQPVATPQQAADRTKVFEKSSDISDVWQRNAVNSYKEFTAFLSLKIVPRRSGVKFEKITLIC